MDNDARASILLDRDFRETTSPLLDGVQLANQGDIGGAELAFRAELRAAPNNPTAHHNFAVFLSSRKRIEEAKSHYRIALGLRPGYLEALNNFATLLREQREFGEAVRQLWAATRLAPTNVRVLTALGETLIGAKCREDGVVILRQASRLAPEDASVQNVLGLALFDSGRLHEAEQTFFEALRIDAKFVSSHNNLGSLYKAMGRLSEALTCFELALALNPKAVKTRWNRALTILSMGDFEHGWREYESRWERSETPPLEVAVPRWDGASLANKTILIHAEQGLGDTVQFIRYAKILKEQGARVTFRCQSPLVAALSQVEGIDQLIDENAPLPIVDTHVPLMSLPLLTGTNSEESIPNNVPYIQADATAASRWKQYLTSLVAPKSYLVGIAWQGNPHHQWDHFRSCRLAELAPLTEISGVRLVSLQRGPGVEQIAAFQRLTDNKLIVPSNGQQLAPEHLAENVAIMANMDLMISVDTATAHLAGALGKPTWIALSFISDWRWMVSRRDSPWYPTVRLFRQEKLGDWPAVFVDMCRQLSTIANRRGQERLIP